MTKRELLRWLEPLEDESPVLFMDLFSREYEVAELKATRDLDFTYLILWLELKETGNEKGGGEGDH